MNFILKIIDAICDIRNKHNKPEFIIGYRLSPEEPYEDGITMTETLKLVRAISSKPIQYIHVSQKNYFQEAKRGEGKGSERLKLIHNETKGKVALIGVGGLNNEKDLNSAINSEFSEFIAVGKASMLNKDFGVLLKEGKGNNLNLEFDKAHPEKYSLPSNVINTETYNISKEKIFSKSDISTIRKGMHISQSNFMSYKKQLLTEISDSKNNLNISMKDKGIERKKTESDSQKKM